MLRTINFLLSLLIFIIPLSPKIPLNIFTRSILIRLEDLFIPVIFILWIIYAYINKKKIFNSALTLPIVAYFCAGLLATLLGLFYKHTVSNPFFAFGLIFRNLEYYLIFFIVLSITKDIAQIRKWLQLWLAAVILVSIYGVIDYFLGISGGITGLYDKGWFYRQSNHMGGYLMIGLILSLSLMDKGKTERLLSIIALPLISFAIIFNLSRTTYLSSLAALTVYFFLKSKKLLYIPVIAALALFLFMPRLINNTHLGKTLSSTVKEAVSFSTKPTDEYNYSPAGHRLRIRDSLKDFSKYPITGMGFGAKPLTLYDSMIAYIPATMGLLGIISCLWLLLCILTQLLLRYRFAVENYAKDFILSLIAVFCGILIHSLSSNAFIIAIISEPFWFLLALSFAFRGIKWNSQ